MQKTAEKIVERLDFANKATLHYLICALWTNEFDNDNVHDLPKETWDAAAADCFKFVRRYWNLIQKSGVDAEHTGHDFWLTRNGHGTGFWDRDELDDKLGRLLTEASEEFGETWIFKGDDGRIYFM
jgi:hypothetical protein